MTDRYNALIVVLERDIRDDDAQPLIDAIKMLKGVLSVEGNVQNIDAVIAESKAKMEIRGKIWDALK